MLKTLLNLLPKNEIADECNDGAGLLMTRYYLSPKIFGLRLVLHQFHRSDNDRHYHDHPWNFISWIIKGSYIEHFPVPNGIYRVPANRNVKVIYGEGVADIQQCHRRWDIIKRPKEWKHWVELLPEPLGRRFVPCWTLVLFYGERREWGFWTKEGWIKHDQYDCRSYDHAGNKHTSTKKS